VVTLKLSLFAALPTTILRLLRFQLFEIRVQSIEPFFPDVPVSLGPVDDVLLWAARAQLMGWNATKPIS
jgi:hypothetical protein